MAWIAVAVGGGALLGGIIQGGAASSAANAQAGAAENAQQISQNEFNTITGQESPYMQAGYGAQQQLNYLLGIGTPGSANAAPSSGSPYVGHGANFGNGGAQFGSPVNAPVNGGGTASSSTGGTYGSLLSPFTAQTMAQYSPAYNFQLQQGRQGVLNGDEGGLGALSGAAQKDLSSFNQNYANTAFNNAFNQYQTQQGNIYSRLAGISQLGQSAASNTGQQGTALAGQAAQSAQNIGTAMAGGTVGAANAYSSALSGVGNAALIGSLYSNNLSQQATNGYNDLVNTSIAPTMNNMWNNFSPTIGPG